MAIKIITPGALTTLQDAGRVGFAAQGWRECGACDLRAFRLANLLVGNQADEAVLELHPDGCNVANG